MQTPTTGENLSPGLPGGMPGAIRRAAGLGAEAVPRAMDPRWERVRRMYAVNAVGLTGVGLTMTLFPDFTRERLLRGKHPDILTFGIVGAVWLSMGVLSALGWRNPRPFLGVLALQAVYKSIALSTAVPRALRAGDRDALPAFGILGAWLAGVLYSLPYRELLSGTSGAQGAAPGESSR